MRPHRRDCDLDQRQTAFPDICIRSRNQSRDPRTKLPVSESLSDSPDRSLLQISLLNWSFKKY